MDTIVPLSPQAVEEGLSGETCCGSPAEEIPLLIQDYSCANSFEDHVRVIEQYLASLFATEQLLQSFLVFPQSSEQRGKPASPTLSKSTGEGVHGTPSFSSHSSSKENDDSTSLSSSVSLLVDSESSSAAATSRVFSRTFTLYSPATPASDEPPPLDMELSVAVEVHVRDATHLITQQYCTPVFFLIRKVSASASYRESETTYLVSLLSTAVRQVLRQQKSGAVFRIGTVNVPLLHSSAATPSAPPPPLPSRAAADALPSPFFFPDGCAPCFAPSGDPYKQTYVGTAPPLPSATALPPRLASSSRHINSAEWALLHQRTFTTQFLADAFAHPPEHCRTLSEFIDLFQLHVGQHSRIRSDDFEGICVSLWKEYSLPAPWRFQPFGPPPAGPAGADTKKRNAKDEAASRPASTRPARNTSAEAQLAPTTWETVLERENSYTQLLCGSFTHTFGTAAPPLKHIRFHFQWNQLQDFEAHEPTGRGRLLDPFSTSAQLTGSATPAGASSPPLSAAAQAAQRKCCITSQAVVRSDAHIEHGVSQRLTEVVEQGYLASLASATASLSPTSRVADGAYPQGRNSDTAEGKGAKQRGVTSQVKPSGQADASPRESPSEDTGKDSNAASRHSRFDEAELRELASCVVGWTGAKVSLQASLLERFAADLHDGRKRGSEDDDDDEACGNAEEHNDVQTCATVMEAASRRNGTAVARHLRHLWTKWETHQQLFSPDPAEHSGPAMQTQQQQPVDSLEAAEREAAAVAARRESNRRLRSKANKKSGSAGEKDLRLDYFPDSFFARFAYVCATQVPHAADVVVLWRLCVEGLQALLIVSPDSSSEEQRKQRQRLLDCLALPAADPPVDLSRPVLSQRFQLLRYALDTLLNPGETLHLSASDGPAATATALPRHTEGGSEAARAAPADATRRLITGGEVLVSPPPLPQAPTTSDVILQRAMEMNVLGAAAVDHATQAWLQSDPLYNDMSLFLYVNGAHEGRVVRFPDFVQWHSPRDFVAAAPPATAAAAINDTPAAVLDDNAYLSERMQDQPRSNTGSSSSPRGSSHVWWALWRRAVPRSRDDILRTLFQPLDKATETLQWLAALPQAELLLELSNACVANTLHRLLCHRFLLGDRDTAPTSAAMLNTSSPFCVGIPPSPRIRSLHRYAQEKVTGLTRDVEAASALFLSRRETRGTTATAPMEAMEVEMLRTLFANALRQLGEIEVALCTALAIHYLLGFCTHPDDAATVRALCAPLPTSSAANAASLQTSTVTVQPSTWSRSFVRQFVRPETRVLQESMVRLTCMAERPLDTCGCFQQLVVHHDATDTLRMALALTKEVL